MRGILLCVGYFTGYGRHPEGAQRPKDLAWRCVVLTSDVVGGEILLCVGYFTGYCCHPEGAQRPKDPPGPSTVPALAYTPGPCRALGASASVELSLTGSPGSS